MTSAKKLASLLTCLALASFPSNFANGADAGAGNQLATALENLDPYIQASMAATNVPGLAIAVVYHGQVVVFEGIRRAEARRASPSRP